ncbi:unnamed protein product [Auanema sp. JU1783]|nr:unnamed protein product [Auanema sp. JU1783]
MDWTIFLYIFQALIVGMFLKCFKVSKNKKFESSSQKNKQALNSPAKDSRKVEKGEKKEEKVQTPTTPKPDPDEKKMTSKEERIAQGKEVRKKTDYATFLDVCSDWEDTSHSDAKKEEGKNVKQVKNGKAVKNDEAKIEPKKGIEKKPEKKRKVKKKAKTKMTAPKKKVGKANQRQALPEQENHQQPEIQNPMQLERPNQPKQIIPKRKKQKRAAKQKN